MGNRIVTAAEQKNTWLKISLPTAAYAFYIIISASFMRQVLNYLLSLLTRAQLGFFIWVLFGTATVPVIFLIKKYLLDRQRYFNLMCIGLIMALGLGYAASFEVVEERFHLVLFGLLGFLAARDNLRKPLWKAFVISVTLCTLVAAVDECFQHILPYRVGDPRDVLFGVVGGTWGILIHLSIFGELALARGTQSRASAMVTASPEPESGEGSSSSPGEEQGERR